jgi:uncharacterized protein YoxC
LDYLHNLAERVRNETVEAKDLATQVYKNTTEILRTLERFDQVVLEGQEKAKRAEMLRPSIDENNVDGREAVASAQNKLAALKRLLGESQLAAFNVARTLGEATHTFEKLQDHVDELARLTLDLQRKARTTASDYVAKTTPRVSEAVQTQKGLSERGALILKQADDVANRTQRLLDDTNNGMEGLNRINKSLSGKYFGFASFFFICFCQFIGFVIEKK